MCFRKGKWITAVCAALTVMLPCSCGVNGRLGGIKSGTVKADVSIPSDDDYRREKEELMAKAIVVDTTSARTAGLPFIMNAIRDEETGEMVATDELPQSTVIARFRNVAERFGMVNIEFDITVPKEMLESQWKVELRPTMRMMGDTIPMEPIHVTGQKYRDEQMRGYARYNKFISSIITDSTDFVRADQLETFIKRYFPDTYAMRNDSSYVSDLEAENLFGVTLSQVREHYTKTGLVARNERRIGNSEKMFNKFVRDPFVKGGLRLDTVLNSADGNFIYRYVQEVTSRPGLKRIEIVLDGNLYESGRPICSMTPSENLDFYVSSLSTLIDPTPRYVLKITERTVYDNTRAFIDFEKGSSFIDTTLSTNAAELERIRKAVDGVMDMQDMVLDSLTVTASCSPEGSYRFNSALATSRSEAVVELLRGMMDEENSRKLLPSAVPENWDQLVLLAQNDSLLSDSSKSRILAAAEMEDKDGAEAVLMELPEFEYIMEHIYPRLRSVKFGFYLHRKGMVKDTVHTTELDTVYLAGVEAIRNLDYKRAVEFLRSYYDCGIVLVCLAVGYDHLVL